MVVSLETDQPYHHHSIADGMVLIDQYSITTKQATNNQSDALQSNPFADEVLSN